VKLSGNDFAGVIQSMTQTAAAAAKIPLVVSSAAARKYAPLGGYLSSGGPTLAIMYWSIWCNESWVGLDAKGPWGTYLDGNTEEALAEYRAVCAMFPRHAEPASSRTRVRSGVPLLALVGGADPQDPVANLAGLRQAMPKSRIVVAPDQGHAIGQYGCLPALTARFVERGSAASLDVSCARKIAPAEFALK
jgi:pimeloyl-ACP methyl ester carboxylesterase